MTVNEAPRQFQVELLNRQNLTDLTFEIHMSRPDGFTFTPGQRIRLSYSEIERDYSLINAPDSDRLSICVRQVADGQMSPLLAKAARGTNFQATGPLGYFTYKSSNRKSVFVATGTGVAPFAAMTRAGINAYILLHGVRKPEELYYRDLFTDSASTYVPCISGGQKVPATYFNGRVTTYLQQTLEPGAYDFYLSGRNDMIRDALWLVDDRFPGSLVYTEIFY